MRAETSADPSGIWPSYPARQLVREHVRVGLKAKGPVRVRQRVRFESGWFDPYSPYRPIHYGLPFAQGTLTCNRRTHCSFGSHRQCVCREWTLLGLDKLTSPRPLSTDVSTLSQIQVPQHGHS